MIFFDGEEAFKDWNEQDSLYGSRHLANKLDSQMLTRTTELGEQSIREIDRIEVLVLLDLIGGDGPQFFNFYQKTQPLHERLYQIERALSSADVLADSRPMFMLRNTYSEVDDDHRPFLEKSIFCNSLTLIKY